MINLFEPYVPPEAIDEVVATLGTRWIGQAHKVDRFEKDFEEKFSLTNCVSVNSGSSALETAYELVGITKGDEVITTPLTCTATNIPLVRMGAQIKWVDINPKTLCIDLKDLSRKVSERTKAIVNVHLGGIENDLGKQPVPVIADACQALGVFNGDYTANSFQAIKHITTGDGGMLTVRNSEEAHKAKLMRWFGIDREKKIANNWAAYTERQMTFDIEIQGYKRQMTDIAAGMGIAGLRHYDRIIAHRKKLFDLYKELLSGIQGIVVVDGKRNTYWLCTVLVNSRDEFAKMLFSNGVETNIVQVRNDVYKIFRGKRVDDLPNMDYVESRYLSLPLHMGITEDNVRFICEKIKGGW